MPQGVSYLTPLRWAQTGPCMVLYSSIGLGRCKLQDLPKETRRGNAARAQGGKGGVHKAGGVLDRAGGIA